MLTTIARFWRSNQQGQDQSLPRQTAMPTARGNHAHTRQEQSRRPEFRPPPPLSPGRTRKHQKAAQPMIHRSPSLPVIRQQLPAQNHLMSLPNQAKSMESVLNPEDDDVDIGHYIKRISEPVDDRIGYLDDQEREMQLDDILLEDNDPHRLSDKEILQLRKMSRQKGFDGIVSIGKQEAEEEEEEELIMLSKIKQFQPLIQQSGSTFSFGNLFSASISQPREVVDEVVLDHDPIYQLLLSYQNHMRRCALEISNEQNLISETVRSVDEFTAKIAQAMTATLNQVRGYSTQMVAVNALIQQTDRTHQLIHDTFQTLKKLDALLPPEDQLSSSSPSVRWPRLHKLMQPKGPKHRSGLGQGFDKRFSMKQKSAAMESDTIATAVITRDVTWDNPQYLTMPENHIIRTPSPASTDSGLSVKKSPEVSNAASRFSALSLWSPEISRRPNQSLSTAIKQGKNYGSTGTEALVATLPESSTAVTPAIAVGEADSSSSSSTSSAQQQASGRGTAPQMRDSSRLRVPTTSSAPRSLPGRGPITRTRLNSDVALGISSANVTGTGMGVGSIGQRRRPKSIPRAINVVVGPVDSKGNERRNNDTIAILADLLARGGNTNHAKREGSNSRPAVNGSTDLTNEEEIMTETTTAEQNNSDSDMFMPSSIIEGETEDHEESAGVSSSGRSGMRKKKGSKIRSIGRSIGRAGKPY